MLQDKLRDFLKKKFPDARDASGRKEIAMRCRFCGDSQTDMSARHLYISLGDDSTPPMYNCFKCPASGILSPEILQRLVDCTEDGELLSILRNSNLKIIRSSKNIIKKTQAYHIHNTFITDGVLSKAKLRYINKRLGLDLSYSDILENKMVLNLYDLLNKNRITKFTRYPNIMDQLNDCFMGFLSMDNGFLSLRNMVYKEKELTKSINLRYVNYNIFEDGISNRKFYAIPSKCNVTSIEPINIRIAEGGYDINSIFYNLCDGNRVQNIYTSVGGKAYLNVVRLYLTDFGLSNVIFHIYTDGDVKTESIKFISNILKPLGIPLYMHRNVFPGEKDFGVPKNRIKDQIIKL